MLAAAAWFWPIRVFDKPVSAVDYIEIYNGGTGQVITVTDPQTVTRLTESYRGVYLRRRFDFGPKVGFNLSTTVYLKDGGTRHFIIGAADYAEAGFRYFSYFGEYDYDYMQSLFEPQPEGDAGTTF